MWKSWQNTPLFTGSQAHLIASGERLWLPTPLFVWFFRWGKLLFRAMRNGGQTYRNVQIFMYVSINKRKIRGSHACWGKCRRKFLDWEWFFSGVSATVSFVSRRDFPHFARKFPGEPYWLFFWLVLDFSIFFLEDGLFDLDISIRFWFDCEVHGFSFGIVSSNWRRSTTWCDALSYENSGKLALGRSGSRLSLICHQPIPFLNVHD